VLDAWGELTWCLIQRLSVFLVLLYITTRWKPLSEPLWGDSAGRVGHAIRVGFWLAFSILGTLLGRATQDYIVNFRTIGAILAGLTGGPWIGMIVGTLSGAHRLSLGGSTAFACALATATGGLLAGFARRDRRIADISCVEIGLVGAIFEIIHRSLVLLLVRPSSVAWEFVSLATVPMLAATSLGTVVCACLLIDVTRTRTQAILQTTLIGELKQSLVDIFGLVGTVVGAKDQYTALHSRNVAKYAVCIGHAMGLEDTSLAYLWLGGLTHDVGKVSVPDAILNKPGRLNEHEWTLIRSHPAVGAQILKKSGPLLARISSFAAGHHERYAGGGYPSGNDERNLLIGILSLADALDAMTSNRPHRGALSSVQVLEELRRHSGEQFNPDAVEKAMDLYAEYGTPHQWPSPRISIDEVVKSWLVLDEQSATVTQKMKELA